MYFNNIYLGINSFFNAFGFGVQSIVLSLIVFNLSENVSSLGKLLAFSMIPRVIMSLFIGYFVDRFDKLKLLKFIQISKILLILILLIFILFEGELTNTIYIITFLWNLIDRAYMPCYKAIIKINNEKDTLTSANAQANIGFQIGMALGTLMSGKIFEIGGEIGSFCLIGITYFISFLIIRKLVIPDKIKDLNSKSTKDNIFKSIGKSLILIVSDKRIIYYACFIGISEYIVQIINILLLPYLTIFMENPSGFLGVLEFCFFIGSIWGGFYLIKLKSKFPLRKYDKFCLLIVFISFISISIIQSRLLSIIVLSILGFVSLQIRTIHSSNLINYISIENQGKINSIVNCLVSLIGSLFYYLVGVYTDHTSILISLFTIGIVFLLVLIIFNHISNKDMSKKV